MDTGGAAPRAPARSCAPHDDDCSTIKTGDLELALVQHVKEKIIGYVHRGFGE
jgi:hypothetical protein